MAHACLAVEGAQCVSLGVQTPAREISQAAVAHSADAVGISFSSAIQISAATASLADLRRQLDPKIALWAGGSLWQRSRRSIDGVDMLVTLADIPRVLEVWRANQGV